MSYILDALKKAEAERDQGPVPNIHTTSRAADLDLEPQVKAAQPWPLVVGLLMVALALAALWWWPRSLPTPVPQAESIPAPSSMPAKQTVVEMPAVDMPVPATMETASVVHATPVQRVINVPPTSTDSAPAPRKVQRTAPAPVEVQPTPAVVEIDPALKIKPKPRVPMLAELPEDVQRQLPQVAVTGAMYSDQPSSRMVLINNRVFHEGDEPLTGLILEEIRLKSAVLNYKGTRYAVSY